MSVHTIDHALHPTRCACTQATIEACVICGRHKAHWSKPNRVDTCSARCTERLRRMQAGGMGA